MYQPVSSHHSNMYRQPVQILVYAFRLYDGEPRWLLLKRSPDRGGFWQGVTGAIEPGEAIEHAAYRELAEETSLVPLWLRSAHLQYQITLRPEWTVRYNFDPAVSTITEHVFFARLPDDAFPVLSHEHTEFKWLELAEALTMLKWPKNIEALDKVARLQSQQH
ncbi:MAG: NUDIX pyrophosphatase [Sedimentisphaerales bacterium]|nr:NUDIX pyrophosphatase [Sedimentisphaerales bacterium]